jgi:hypothetical protein
MMHDFYINLTTTDDEYPVFRTSGFTKLAVNIIADTTNFTWGAAVATVQYSVRTGVNADGEDLADWQAFLSNTTLITTRTSVRGIGISGVGFVRIHVTTADGGADMHAPITVMLT